MAVKIIESACATIQGFSRAVIERLAGWAFLVLLGPLMFRGEIVGPTGHVAWRQLAAGLIGTMLYTFVGMAVIGYV